MTPAGLLRLRLENQRLARPSFRKPEDVVAWFGALQAQDYLGSLWAIGQRMTKATEALVEAAEARRAIVRTWPMRGTLHFVAAADARWMTRLLAPRVMARNAARLKREVDVDASVIGRARNIVARALEGGARLERTAVYEALESRKVRTANSRGLHILLCLAMEGTLCLAGRQGKQHTFALLDEWIPKRRSLDRAEALAELAKRYFSSHGPATLQDFMWWAGITAKDAGAGVNGAQRHLVREDLDGRRYWMAARHAHSKRTPAPIVKLLPGYDEYTVGYRDRSQLVDQAAGLSGSFGLLSPVVVVDGRIVGFWKRTISRNEVQIATKLNRALRPAEKKALHAETERYATFLGVEMRRSPAHAALDDFHGRGL
jgi:hypothetical protein